MANTCSRIQSVYRDALENSGFAINESNEGRKRVIKDALLDTAAVEGIEGQDMLDDGTRMCVPVYFLDCCLGGAEGQIVACSMRRAPADAASNFACRAPVQRSARKARAQALPHGKVERM